MSQAAIERVAGPRQLLAKPDFRRVYLAGAAGQLGDAFQFVALLWYAVLLGGPLGVMVARVCGHPALSALAGTFLVGVGTGAAFVLMTSATRVGRGERARASHGNHFPRQFRRQAAGLLLIAPFYAFLDPGVMFLAGGVAVFVCALVAAALVDVATRRYREAAAAV